MPDIIINEKGQKVVRIDTIKFSSKRRIDWAGVEDYLKRYVGEEYVIDETDDVIYIGNDFPDEYANSTDTVQKHLARSARQKQMPPRLSRNLLKLQRI